MTLETTLKLSLDAPLLKAAIGNLGTPQHPIRLAPAPLTWADGTGVDQADIAYAAQFTIAGSGTQAIDLNAITDTLGKALTFAKVKVLAFLADAANGDRIDIGPAAVEGFDQWIGTVTTAEIRLYPGDLFVLTRKSAGWTITNNVDDKLLLTNLDGSSVVIDVVIIGTDT